MRTHHLARDCVSNASVRTPGRPLNCEEDGARPLLPESGRCVSGKKLIQSPSTTRSYSSERSCPGSKA